MIFGDPNEHFADMMAEVPLHHGLVDYVIDGAMGKMVHHPLVISFLPQGVERAKLINDLYEQKLARLGECAMNDDFFRMIMLYERPYRFDGLEAAIRNGLKNNPAEFWRLLGWVWSDSENIYENLDAWRELWRSGCPERQSAMSVEDQIELEKLPEIITVYRGFSNIGTEMGMSWTTKRETAKWFANRFSDDARVITGSVNKSSVYAFLTTRDEYEIVVDPRNVKDIHDAS